MWALWGLFMIGFAKLSEFMGVTIAAQKVIGLLAIIGWFINLNWPSVFR